MGSLISLPQRKKGTMAELETKKKKKAMPRKKNERK